MEWRNKLPSALVQVFFVFKFNVQWEVHSVIIVILDFLWSVVSAHTVHKVSTALRKLLHGFLNLFKLSSKLCDPYCGLHEWPGNISPTIVIKCKGYSGCLASVGVDWFREGRALPMCFVDSLNSYNAIMDQGKRAFDLLVVKCVSKNWWGINVFATAAARPSPLTGFPTGRFKSSTPSSFWAPAMAVQWAPKAWRTNEPLNIPLKLWNMLVIIQWNNIACTSLSSPSESLYAKWKFSRYHTAHSCWISLVGHYPIFELKKAMRTMIAIDLNGLCHESEMHCLAWIKKSSNWNQMNTWNAYQPIDHTGSCDLLRYIIKEGIPHNLHGRNNLPWWNCLWIQLTSKRVGMKAQHQILMSMPTGRWELLRLPLGLLTGISASMVTEVGVTATEVVFDFGAWEPECGFWHLADETESDGAGL